MVTGGWGLGKMGRCWLKSIHSLMFLPFIAKLSKSVFLPKLHKYLSVVYLFYINPDASQNYFSIEPEVRFQI